MCSKDMRVPVNIGFPPKTLSSWTMCTFSCLLMLFRIARKGSLRGGDGDALAGVELGYGGFEFISEAV